MYSITNYFHSFFNWEAIASRLKRHWLPKMCTPFPAQSTELILYVPGVQSWFLIGRQLVPLVINDCCFVFISTILFVFQFHVQVTFNEFLSLRSWLQKIITKVGFLYYKTVQTNFLIQAVIIYLQSLLWDCQK